MSKTNAVRKLDRFNIIYQLAEYKFTEDEINAVSVARKIGVGPERVFKTLVARNEKNLIFVFVIPGNFCLHLKKAAKISKSKKIELIKEKELQPLTGYIKGGCSPICMKKNFRTFLDETAQLWETIYVSAGIRGTQVKIFPQDLANLIDAKFADII